jgi:ribosome biogenesis GTPase
LDLYRYGWDESWQEKWEKAEAPGLEPARVLEVSGSGWYRLQWAVGECVGTVSGRFRHRVQSRSDFPAVGDWVLVSVPGASLEELSLEFTSNLAADAAMMDKVVIRAVLPRSSAFVRKVSGREFEAQVVAANVNRVFIVCAATDVNARRLERYLAVAHESQAVPVVVVSKVDLLEDTGKEVLESVRNIGLGCEVYGVSVTSRVGLGELVPHLSPGQTIALLGSSGAGKSTLLNCLMGDNLQRVGETRKQDGRGRHTTTRRTLFVLPGGAMVIDTPGMRELALWDGEANLDDAFEDIVQLAQACTYRDCRHTTEPGCAVQQAVQQGQLSDMRFKNYVKMLAELAYVARKQSAQQMQEERNRWKKLTKEARQRSPRHRLR